MGPHRWVSLRARCDVMILPSLRHHLAHYSLIVALAGRTCLRQLLDYYQETLSFDSSALTKMTVQTDSARGDAEKDSWA